MAGGLRPGLDDRAPPPEQELFQATKDDVEGESEDPDHRGADEHPVHQEEVPRLLDAVADGSTLMHVAREYRLEIAWHRVVAVGRGQETVPEV